LPQLSSGPLGRKNGLLKTERALVSHFNVKVIQ
jgi:hypothetical protein